MGGGRGKAHLVVFDDRGVEVAHEMLHHPEEAQRDGVPRLELKDALIRRARVVQPPGGEGYFNFSMPRTEKRACVGGNGCVLELAVARPEVEVRRGPGLLRGLRDLCEIQGALKEARSGVEAWRATFVN